MRRCSLLALSAIACARPTQSVSPDRELSSFFRAQIVGAPSGAGRSRNEVYVPADSTTAAIMRLAQIPIHEPAKVYCPGGTEANGDRAQGTLGHVVQVSVKGEGDTRLVFISFSCWYRGMEERPFAQGSFFEIKREHGHWRVTRQIGSFIP